MDRAVNEAQEEVEVLRVRLRFSCFTLAPHPGVLSAELKKVSGLLSNIMHASEEAGSVRCSPQIPRLTWR